MSALPSAAVDSKELTGSQALKADFVAGFLVFLIAMPLCLAIANACKFPPICGVWTAVVGGLVTTWISNSQLTIKGPAAGLIVIVLGSVNGFTDAYYPRPEGYAQMSETEQVEVDKARTLEGFKCTLAVGIIAGLIQVAFGVFKAGRLGDFFPLAAVHGLLASIGIIILFKSLPVVLGVPGAISGQFKEPLKLIAATPTVIIPNLNPTIAIVGVLSMVIMFAMPLLKNKTIRRIPAQLVVLVIAVPLAIYLGFSEAQKVDMPNVIDNPSEAFFLPNFEHVVSLVGLQYIVLFSLVGTLESLLSAKAVDLLDPQKRKSDMNKDILGIGVGNTLVACFGGLPMISEIVRSSANITNGAQTRRANFFHGCFLLAFVLFLPMVIRMIPNAALSAMLVYTGFRLAHPMEFVKTYKVGKEQIVIFLTTIFFTLAVDMLVGVFAGVVVKFLLNMVHGASLRAAWKPGIECERTGETSGKIVVHDAAVFSNWLVVKRKIDEFGPASRLTVDLGDVRYVDHSVMEKLHELEADFKRAGGELMVVGLEDHKKLSNHPQAARKKILAALKKDTAPTS